MALSQAHFKLAPSEGLACLDNSLYECSSSHSDRPLRFELGGPACLGGFHLAGAGRSACSSSGRPLMLASLAASAPWAPSQKQADARAGSTPASGGAAARANSSCGGDAVDAPPQAQQPRAAALVQGGADASLASIGRSSAVALTAAAVVGSVPFEALVDVVGEVLLAQLVHLKLLFAGACSAVVSRTAMAPLERVKMDQLLCSAPHGASTLQAARRIYDNEGVRGFWKVCARVGCGCQGQESACQLAQGHCWLAPISASPLAGDWMQHSNMHVAYDARPTALTVLTTLPPPA